jgi:hypothetical protein
LDLPDITDKSRAVAYYRENFAGRLCTGWDFYRLAAASSYLKAAEALTDVIKSWQQGLEANASRGQISFFLDFNYKIHVSGPLFSAVILPAIAIESLIRLLAQVLLFERTDESDLIVLGVAAIDAMPFSDRVTRVLEMADAGPVPKNLRKRLDALIAFRNSAVHDTPYLMGHAGESLQVKRSRVARIDERAPFQGLYPLLNEDNMPLTLDHALAAISTHDDLAKHIETAANPELLVSFSTHVSGAYRFGSITDVGGVLWDQSKKVAEFWRDNVLTWEAGVTLEEHGNFIRDVERPMRVKLEKEED